MGVINDFIPMKVEQTISNTPRQSITAERWNELWNLNVVQGDHSEVWLQHLVDAHNSLTTDVSAALALKSDKAVTNQHYKSVTFNANTGIFTFTREDGSFTTIDTALEKVATNWQYDSITQELVLTLVDGSTQRVSLSAFITENEFVDSSTVVFSVSSHKVTAGIKPGSLNDTHFTSAFLASLQNQVTQAQASATAAANSATDAASSASLAGTRASASATSATAASNSKDAAASSATAAASSATAASGSASSASTSATSATASANSASSSASIATGAATTAANAAFIDESSANPFSSNTRVKILGAVESKVIHGFAQDLNLSDAVRQITPSGYQVRLLGDQQVGNRKVSWRGGKDWAQVLRDMIAADRNGVAINEAAF